MSFQQPQLILVNATTVSDGQICSVPPSPIQFSAYLSGAGGSATVNIYTREISSAPWYLRGSFLLSGASARDSFAVTGEAWAQAYASVPAISGATVNVVMGG